MGCSTGGGAGVGESVSSVNRTLFSILVLQPLSRRRPSTPCLRTWIRTATAVPSLYHFKRHLDPSKGVLRRGIASQCQTTEFLRRTSTPTVDEMLHAFPCLPCDRAAALLAQPCSCATKVHFCCADECEFADSRLLHQVIRDG